jgi:hypothetical protein
MLTLPALTNWDVNRYQDVIPRADFVGIFIPADRGWHAQLHDAAPADEKHESAAITIGRVAFTTHVLTSFVQTLRDLSLLEGSQSSPLVNRPPVLKGTEEIAFVEEVARVWRLSPPLRSLGGLSIALRARLVELGSLRDTVRRSADPESVLIAGAPYADLNFRDCISHAVETHSVLTGDRDSSWAFLFDEFEVAPSHIQRDVLNSLRGEFDNRILYKIALAPYNENFMRNVSDISASPGHDFRVIDLWYPDKARGYEFAEQLVTRLLEEQGIQADSLRRVFGPSEFGFPEGDDTRPYGEDGKVLEAFVRLAKSDPSFRSHLASKKIDLTRIAEMSEAERAEKVRKLRSIVITRDYFLRSDKDLPERLKGRSRKIKTLYTGFPTILALCEGNPRLLIGITTPLIRRLKHFRAANASRSIDKPSQAAQIKLAANSFRSMLKTIPYEGSEGGRPNSLLKLLDDIGEYFHRKCVLEDFSPQPPLSFIVDSTVNNKTLSAIGRALNAGAIVYVPDPGADPILSSLRGKRFRLCYLLAAYHKLPIMLNTAVSLSTILEDKVVAKISRKSHPGQVDMFLGGAE